MAHILHENMIFLWGGEGNRAPKTPASVPFIRAKFAALLLAQIVDASHHGNNCRMKWIGKIVPLSPFYPCAERTENGNRCCVL